MNKRPTGSNADEWALFLSEHHGATEFLAVQIAEAIEQAWCKWEPIETAPKMKDILLFAVTHIGANGEVLNWKMATGFWHSGYENDERKSPWNWGGSQLMKYETHPTCWSSLPAPPEDE